MMKLMAYADGELEGSDVAEVEKLLVKEPDAVRFIEQIADLGDLVKTGHTPKAFDIADLVMAKAKDIELDAPKKAGNVVSLMDAMDAKKKRTQQITIGAGIAAALALAASIFLFKKPEETPMAKGPAPIIAPANESAGIEVETANESPGQSIKVLYGPGQNEMSTSVVIWVEEKP
jgi:hypothetical protein